MANRDQERRDAYEHGLAVGKGQADHSTYRSWYAKARAELRAAYDKGRINGMKARR